MANVKQDQKVQAGSAELSKPKLRLRTRLMETLDRIFTTRQEKLVGERGLLAAPMGRRRMLALGAAAVLAACAPLPAVANPTEAPSADKSKAQVEYETFSDPKEIQPLFDNAKGKFVNLKRGETKTIGDYKVRIYHDGDSGVVFEVTPKGESSHMGVVLSSPLPDINILVVDAGNDNPHFKGKMLVFADSDGVYLQYFNKREGRHELSAIPLYEGEMRKGPLNTGYAFDEGAIVVLNAPKDLKPGDVVCQADLAPDGSSGRSYYIYAPEKPPGTIVAMR